LSNVQLIGVSGPEKTVLYGMRFECDSGARISGFTMQNEGLSGEAVIQMKDATVVGNILLGHSPLSGIFVEAGSYTAYIGSNILHGFNDAIRVKNGSLATTAVIYNNTAVRNGAGIVFGAANSITIRNNLVIDNRVYGVERNCGGNDLNFLDVDHNWVSLNTSHDYVTTVPLPTQTCNSPLTLGPGPNDVLTTWNMADFVDADGLDFHLVPTSQAVGLGGSLGVVPWLGIDIDGDPRSALDFAYATQPHQPDIGADEANSSRLGVERHLVNWVLTTTMACPGCFEGTVLSWRPGLTPILNSLWLQDSYTLLGAFPFGFTDPSTHLMPRTTWLLGGTRLYVQSLVIDPAAELLSFTNTIVLTH
jgi:parallel beta-helix repeat protein